MMGSIAFTVAVGAVFVLLGRWMYRNPSRLMPSWGILNREHPGVQKVARGYATFFIFFGMFASSAVVLGFLLPGIPGMPVLGLMVAAVGTWLLRPRLAPPAADMIEPTIRGPIDSTAKQSLLSKHWKRSLAIFVGFMVLFLCFVFVVIGNSAVAKMAFAAAQVSPVVREQLGEPLKRSFFTSGNIQVSDSTGQADIAVPISGPKGKATLYVEARKSAGHWKIETLEVSFNPEGTRVDLLNHGAESDQR